MTLETWALYFLDSSRLSMHREARFEVSQALFSREQNVGRLSAVLFIKNVCLQFLTKHFINFRTTYLLFV